ncbi:Peroxisomal biogenesis factor 11 (PEX11) [Ceratocystis platani]|uniref:Peroxisomal biogenesis factor 11 (PEX11) n=1 Tax=Ceratocystis fimbriata f. sp. platani TaxID=88771 RepID=A0A0F8B2P1_CERFI|nr:Peroxisomal biogenesis factor 11 (PEX11) [Ceratocystis platani]
MTLTDAVVVPTTSVAQYLFFVLNTLGRDKIIRCLQYFGRFYTWYLLRTNGTKAQIAPWEAVKKQLGLEPVLRYMNMMHALCFTIYLSFDSATLLDATGIRKMEKAKLYQREANRFWAMGLIASMLAQSYRLFLLNERLSTIDKKEADGVVEFRKAIHIVSVSSKLTKFSE